MAITLQDLENGNIAAFASLPPKQRRVLLNEAGLHLATSQKRTKVAESAAKVRGFPLINVLIN